jgi:aryl-alcohol dehydrogenase (NADP+)
MDHTHLGRTGLTVSRLCLGTMTFGSQCDEDTSRAILDASADAGITFIDTADVYPIAGSAATVGRTEEIIGRWLIGRRQDFVVATKCVGPTGPNPWDRGASRKHVLDAIDASLRRLGTDYVDLYQLHHPDPRTPIDETLEALDTVVRTGRARYVGCSNFLAYQVARAIGRSEARNLVRFESVQPRYNLLFRQIERDLLPLCAEEGIGVIPYNPLAGGFLTGKHRRSGPPEGGTRFALGSAGDLYRDRYWHDNEFDTLEELGSLADKAGLSMPTMAVAWVLANPTVTAAIVGASRPSQLVESVDALDKPLDSALKESLDAITAEYRRGDAAR